MTAKTKFKSPAFEAIHSAAAGLSSVNAISAETMRTFDKACLTSVQDLQPVEIKALREKLKVSQPVFAHYLNTSVSTVQKWESGAKRPNGISLKLLDEATSCLDRTSEERLMSSLTDVVHAGKHSALIVAHRLTTAQRCDLIAVIDKGLLAEYGTHEQLLSAGGLYTRLWHDSVSSTALHRQHNMKEETPG